MGKLTRGDVPSKKTIASVLRVDASKAKEIRSLLDGSKDPAGYASVKALPAARRLADRVEHEIDLVLEACNEVLGHFGVEALFDNGNDPFYHGVGVLYTNSGETYDPCVMYDTRSDRFVVGAYGDIVETQEKRFRDS
jgi:hypothetical protein